MIMIFATIKQSYVILNLDADCSFYCPKLISKNKIFKDMSDQQHGSVPLWRTVIEDAYILHHKTLCISLKKCLQHFIKEMFKKKFRSFTKRSEHNP